jgi:hypothetical protein
VAVILFDICFETLSLYVVHRIRSLDSHTQINIQSHSFVYINLYVIRHQTGRQNVPNRIVVRIPRLQSVLNFFITAMFIVTVVPKYLNVATFSKVSLVTIDNGFVLHFDDEHEHTLPLHLLVPHLLIDV